ncbi:hypothetical protein D3C87_2016130 [compost metagenome]
MDRVIAAWQAGTDLAFEPGTTTAQQRQTVRSPVDFKASEFVDARGGKTVRQIDLIFGQDVDGEVRGAAENRMAGRLGRLAPQHQRWIQ